MLLRKLLETDYFSLFSFVGDYTAITRPLLVMMRNFNHFYEYFDFNSSMLRYKTKLLQLYTRISW
uniref:Uncharacterized protein n=1 Tax=Anopheles atroparvus TaxID=41427 RepID=A0AAG5DSA6_ANOAO